MTFPCVNFDLDKGIWCDVGVWIGICGVMRWMFFSGFGLLVYRRENMTVFGFARIYECIIMMVVCSSRIWVWFIGLPRGENDSIWICQDMNYDGSV